MPSGGRPPNIASGGAGETSPIDEGRALPDDGEPFGVVDVLVGGEAVDQSARMSHLVWFTWIV